MLLPPSEKHRVAALWELVDGGAGFDEVLDALLDTGLRGLPGFVLVSEADGRTRIVIRGDARATFTTAEGPVEVDGSRAATWVERTLPGVTAMTIEVAETEAGDLAVAGGLVRLGRFDEPPFAPEPPGPPEPPEPVAEPVAEPAPPEAPDITDLPTGPFPAPDRPIWEPPAPEPPLPPRPCRPRPPAARSPTTTTTTTA